MTCTNPQGRKSSPGLCGPGPLGGSPQEAREELVLLAAPVTAAFESFGAVTGDGGREAVGTKVGRQKDASLPKTHPYIQGISHSPSELRVGDTSGLSGMNLGPGSEPEFQAHLTSGLCTCTKLCSYWALLFSSLKWV